MCVDKQTFGKRKTTELPGLPIRAVRPTLCINTFGSWGESYCIRNTKTIASFLRLNAISSA